MSPLASLYRWWIGIACLIWLAGCAMPPRAPVTAGTPGVTAAPASNLPAPTLVTAVAQPGVTLVPGRLVAPVGNEVLLVSAVHQTGRPQAPYQRVEWLLSPNSVGTFLSVASSDKPYVVQLFGGANPRKLDNNYAVSETAAVARVLDRGTAITTDDVSILPGQAWLTLTSPVEGVSFVTAYAPEITGTLTNRQTAAIYWVDARWVLSPTQNAAVGGPAVVTATVFRQSTGQPVPNWRVRFTVGGGPPVNLSAAGAQSAEVTTNAQGQASIELTQVTPAAATNALTVELIRPAEATPGAVEPLTVGTAQTQVVWTEGAIAPPALTPAPLPPANPPNSATPPPATTPIRLTLIGPRSGPVNTPVRFQLDITNLGSTALENVVLSDRLDPGWRHSTGLSTIKRTIPAIQAGQTVTVPIEILPVQAGRLCQTITAETASGQPATVRECFDALPATGAGAVGTVTPAPVNPGTPANPNATPANPNPLAGQTPENTGLRIALNSPVREMAVGEEQKFNVEIVNTGDVLIPEIKVVLRIDEQLQLTQTRYQEPQYGFQRDPLNRTFSYVFKNLSPKQSLNSPLDFVLRAVRQTAPNQQARIDVTVTAGGVPLADQKLLAITPPRAASATAGSRTDLALSRDNPPQIQLGTRQKISVVLSNSGSAADKNVQLLVSLPDLVTFQETDITSKVRMSIEGNVVRFDPLPELPAGQSVLVTIGYQAAKVGTGQFTAKFVSQEQPQGQTRTENLQVFDNP